MDGAAQCLHCTHTAPTEADWLNFCELMHKHHSIQVDTGLIHFNSKGDGMGLLDSFRSAKGLAALLADMKSLAGLDKFLAENSDASPKIESGRTGISGATVTAWNLWSQSSLSPTSSPSSLLKGLRLVDGRYQPTQSHVPALSSLVREQVDDNWHGEIQEIGGLEMSKSDLKTMTSLDEMATTCCAELVALITPENLQNILTHTGIRILNRPNPLCDFVVKFGWDDLTFLNQVDGSHHFAAARYIAGQLGIKVPISGRKVSFEFDQKSVAALNDQFTMFTIRSDMLYDFLTAMQPCGAPYYTRPLPPPHHLHTTAIFLPKDDNLSVKVAERLHQAGWLDLGQHFQLVGVLKPSLSTSDEDIESDRLCDAPRF